MPVTAQTEELETMRLFLGILSHELKTPLSNIKHASYFMRQGVNTDFYLNVIDYSVIHTLQVLNNLLKTVQIRDGRLATEKKNETFAFKPWIQEHLEFFKPTVTVVNKEIRLLVNAEMENAIVTLDKTKLGQILDNLLSNALRYSYAQSCVIVKCHIGNECLVIQVENAGHIIPTDKIAILFKAYSSIHNGQVGAGLGLYISNIYAEALGGLIKVDSNDSATIFTVIIPL